MILVYPSTLDGEPLEKHAVSRGTFGQWLKTVAPDYGPRDVHPISVTVDGMVIPPAQWDALRLDGGDVEVRPQPADPVTVAYVVVAAVIAVAAAVILAPSIPSVSNKSSRQGRSLYEVNAQGNQAKLGDIIPELAGRHRMYPDYLNAPRRYFVDLNTQALDMLLCIGVGEFDIDTAEIRIGETPIDSLGSSVSYQIFGPGESVAGHPAHRCWYNAPEVGASTGSSGLRLRSTSTATYDGGVSASGNTLTFTVPDTWEEQMTVNVKLYQPIAVVDGGSTVETKTVVTSATITDGDTKTVVTGVNVTRDPQTNEITAVDQVTGDVISGSASDVQTDTITTTTPNRDIVQGDWTGLAAGDRVRISSDELNGTFIIEAITGADMTLNTLAGDPVTSLAPGNYEAAVDVQGATYRITAIGVNNADMEVLRLDSDGNIDAGWSSFPSVSGSANISIAEGSTGTWTGPFQACPDDELVSLLEVDFYAANGLGRLNDDGDIKNVSRRINIQWRPVGASEWSSVTKTISANTRDQIGWTFSVDLGSSMVPEVRVRRLEPEDTDTKALDKIDWYGMRTEIPGKDVYQDITSIALTIEGSNTLASQSENQVSIVPIRKLPVREDGAWTEPRATRNIAPWVAHIARDAGWSDGDINLTELDRLDAVWQSRGDYFDFVTDDDSTVKESINRALTAGFAELTIDRGQIRPVRDEPRGELPQHGYSAQNMLPGSFSRTISLPQPDDADGIDVEYIDGESWTSQVVECRLPGDLGERVEKKKVEGVLDETRAWRIGMRERRKQRYRREAYEFETELDAMNSSYMSHIAITDDVVGYGSSGQVVSAQDTGAGVMIELTEVVDFTEGADHVIAWRRPDGTLAGPYPATKVSDIIVMADAPETPDLDPMIERPHYQFGTVERWSYDALVDDLSPNGFESVSVSAINNDPRVFADDDSEPT